MSEKLNLHPWLVSELHSSLQRSNQDSKPLFIGEDSISAPIVAVSVRLHCRRCGAHAYSVPVSTQLVTVRVCESGHCCVWERGYLSGLYGVFRNVANSRAVVTLWRQLVTVDFDDVSLQKYVQLII